MKALYVTTETNETEKYGQSFASVNGNQVKHHVFSHRFMPGCSRGAELDKEIYTDAKAYAPDLIIYLGACGGNIPSIQLFTQLRREIAPTVLICSDAADVVSPWTYLLSEYDKAGAFSCVVAIDGNRNWEFSDRHLTLLTPIDPKRYPDPPRQHSERSMLFGFAGNMGSFYASKNGKPAGRRPLIAEMQGFGLMCRQRDDSFDKTKPHDESYKGCADFLSDSCIVPNFCETGSYERTHVKGRVVEAGLAGAMLIEQIGSPADQWFEKGGDFLEYADTKHARSIVKQYKDRRDETQAIGFRLREKVIANHSPEKFWGKVVERIEALK